MALAASGGVNMYGEFPSDNRTSFIEGVTFFLLQAGWKLTEKVSAKVTSGTLSSNPVDGTQRTVQGRVYTFKTVLNQKIPYQVQIGATFDDSYNNLGLAINRQLAGAGIAFSKSTPAHPTCTAQYVSPHLSIEYRYAGPYGNGVTTSFGVLLGGGFKVTGQSWQQGATSGDYLKVTAYIYDIQGFTSDSHGTYAAALIQFISARDVTRVSPVKPMAIVPGRRHRIVANCCQFFIFVPGVDIEQRGSVIAGGVPWIGSSTTQVDQSGNVPQASTDEAWWISNDLGPFPTFRTVLCGTDRITQVALDQTGGISLVGGVSTGQSGDHCGDACWNTSVTVNAMGLATLVASDRWDQELSAIAPTPGLVGLTEWHGGLGFKLEPLICWPDPMGASPAEVRGQLWDAWIKTKQVAMDSIEDQNTMGLESLVTDPTYFWLAFTDRYKFGSLWLLVPPLTQIESYQSNYAF